MAHCQIALFFSHYYFSLYDVKYKYCGCRFDALVIDGQLLLHVVMDYAAIYFRTACAISIEEVGVDSELLVAGLART